MAMNPSLPLDQFSTSDRGCLQLPETFVWPSLLDALDQQPPCQYFDVAGIVAAVESVSCSLPHRLVAGAVLAAVGDPRIDLDNPLMVTVPGCTFRMGLEADAVD